MSYQTIIVGIKSKQDITFHHPCVSEKIFGLVPQKKQFFVSINPNRLKSLVHSSSGLSHTKEMTWKTEKVTAAEQSRRLKTTCTIPSRDDLDPNRLRVSGILP